MRKYVDVIIDYEDYITSIEDIKVKVKRSKHETFYTITKSPFILDENGEEYVLTFGSVDIGGGGPCDCLDDFSYIFRINEEQFKALNTLTGFLGMGVCVPSYSCNPMQGKEPKSEVWKKIEQAFYSIGKLEEFLEYTELTNEDLHSETYCFLTKVPLDN